MPNGVSHPGGVEILRMPASVQVNLSRGTKTAIDDHNQGGCLNDPVVEKEREGNAARKASGSLKIRYPSTFAPLSGGSFGLRQRLRVLPSQFGRRWLPHAAEVWLAIGGARSGARNHGPIG